jgi:hypothetical protein
VPFVEPNLFTGTQAADVVAQFAAARGASPLRILSMGIYPDFAVAEVQDPNIPANVDEYKWRGAVESPTPVRLSGLEDVDTSLFSDTDVNWAVIPGLVEVALAQIPIEGAEVTHIIVTRNIPFSDDVRIRVYVNGTRSSGSVSADVQGNVIEVFT